MLSDDEIEVVRTNLETLRVEFSSRLDDEHTRDLSDAGNDRDLNIVNLVRWTAAADRLLDHPAVFGKVLGLMGPFIQVSGTEVFFRYPSDRPLLGFHTDGGPALQRIFPEPRSNVLSLKVQFFLTDVVQPDSGNFTVAPGSHRVPFPVGRVEEHDLYARRRQILARAGDAVIFPWALWHGVAPNTTGTTRVSVIIRYAQMWCRPVDYWTTEPHIHERLNPRQRRLLGEMVAGTAPKDYYRPLSNQLEIMYGKEWSESYEAAPYFASDSYFKTIYAKRQPLGVTHDG